MSKTPDDRSDTPAYTAAQWHEQAVAADDAARAIEHGDLRLLAFATRGTHIPGIDPAQAEAYSERCGVRYIEGFGDVVRSEEQLQRMTRAEAWAEAYNRRIIDACAATR